MKKIAIFIIATVSFICLYNLPAYAATLNQLLLNYQNVVYLRRNNSDGYSYQICVSSGNTYFMANDNIYHTDNYNNDIELSGWASGYLPNFNFYTFLSDPLLNPDIESRSGNSTTYVTGDLLVNVQANNPWNFFENNTENQLVFESLQDYEDFLNPPGEDTWVDTLFGDFADWLESLGLTGVSGFLDWIKDGWTVKVGEGENELAINLVTPTPSPIPTPTPTPIPYQTVLQPDGNGGYQIEYIYPDPSGNPTSAPMPPNNTNITNNYGSDFEYPYYNNPDNINDPYDLDIPWYLKFVFNDQTTSLSDFQDGIDATITTVNNSEEEINTVMDSMSIFPVEWLLMIGFIGAIPLVGGIISRLLKG